MPYDTIMWRGGKRARDGLLHANAFGPEGYSREKSPPNEKVGRAVGGGPPRLAGSQAGFGVDENHFFCILFRGWSITKTSDRPLIISHYPPPRGGTKHAGPGAPEQRPTCK